MTKQIAITIPTFLRFNKLKKEVKSIIKKCPSDSYKLYIGDQGNSFFRKRRLLQYT